MIRIKSAWLAGGIRQRLSLFYGSDHIAEPTAWSRAAPNPHGGTHDADHANPDLASRPGQPSILAVASCGLRRQQRLLIALGHMISDKYFWVFVIATVDVAARQVVRIASKH